MGLSTYWAEYATNEQPIDQQKAHVSIWMPVQTNESFCDRFSYEDGRRFQIQYFIDLNTFILLQINVGGSVVQFCLWQ